MAVVKTNPASPSDNVIQAVADVPDLTLRPFSDAQASQVFRVQNAAGTVTLLTIDATGHLGGAGAAPSGAVILAPDTPTRNRVQPTADTNEGLEIDSHSAGQSAALLRIKNGSETLLGVGGAFGSGTSILDSQTLFLAAPGASTAPVFAEFIPQSGLDNMWLENTGIGPTRSSVACFSNDNGDAALRVFSNGAGQTAPILQVAHQGGSVLDVGPNTIGFLGAAAVVRQVGASAAAIALIADPNAKAAISALQTALANLGLVTSPA